MSVQSLDEMPDGLTVKLVEIGGASNLLEVMLYCVEERDEGVRLGSLVSSKSKGG